MSVFTIWFIRWFVYFYFKTGLARAWYKLYQFIWEGKKKSRVRRFDTMEALVLYMGAMKWRPDTWRELWDAINSPEAIQWKADNQPSRFIGDCDEFAVYEANTVNNELADDSFWGGGELLGASLLTVMWYKTGGAEWEYNNKGFGGHNVCLLAYKDRTFSWMDYGNPHGRKTSIQEVVDEVRKMYAMEYVPLGWVASSPRSLKAALVQKE